MSQSNEGEGKLPEGAKVEVQPTKLSKAQEQQRARMEQQMRQEAERELNDYKKRLTKSNELKRLQVEELQLNIAYYEKKKEWLDLIPKMDDLEAKEKKMMQEEEEKNARLLAEQQEKAAKEKKPDIVLPKQGVPRK